MPNVSSLVQRKEAEKEIVVLPSASSILGMSRNFSATSKAVLRLPMGSSCTDRQAEKDYPHKCQHCAS
uniref:Uncharacterized protein n=1 Tax=Anguilla anguilla TaxID=7936 RepID=A0A0E9QNQ4_ANGAN